eukprot:15331952-Ditylum_brightwellii.AAC.1
MCVTNTVNKRASALTLKSPQSLLSLKPGLSPLQLLRRAGAASGNASSLVVDRTISVAGTEYTVVRTEPCEESTKISLVKKCTSSVSRPLNSALNGPEESTIPANGAPLESVATLKCQAAPEPTVEAQAPAPAWLKDGQSEKPKQKRRRKPQKPGKTAMMNERHFVKHNYHDHAEEPYDFEADQSIVDESRRITADGKRRGGVAVCFPQKLHLMLDQIEADGLAP